MSNSKLFCVLVVTVAMTFGIMAKTAQAVYIWDLQNGSQPITIANLLSEHDGLMLVGDKLFDFAAVSDPVITVATGDAVGPQEDGIMLSGVFIDGDYGLKFNGGWSAAAFETVNSTITFKVTATAPGWYIHDNALWMSAFAVDPQQDGNPNPNATSQNARVSISENVFSVEPIGQNLIDPNVVLADKLVRWLGLGHPANKIYDSQIYSDAYESVWVKKDITVSGGTYGDDPTSFAHLSEFYQTFSQVPEPATMALLGIGAATMLMGRRRRA